MMQTGPKGVGCLLMSGLDRILPLLPGPDTTPRGSMSSWWMSGMARYASFYCDTALAILLLCPSDQVYATKEH